MNAPIRVAVTGAAGNIGYSLLWRLGSGDCFGPDQPILLSLLEITPVLPKLDGVIMELEDSAFGLVHGIEGTDDAEVAFGDADAIFLVGSRPRTADMTRGDLVRANGPIFTGQGRAINGAKKSVRVITVGNPCNTNCLIANSNAPDIDSGRFTAMTRLDQNRAVGRLAARAGVVPAAVRDVIIWGNHGPTMYPDVSRAMINGESAAGRFDQDWLQGEFLTSVAGRGKAIINARGASSAASAANAAVDHMRDWWQGTDGRIVSMAWSSKGQYGVPEGLIFSFPTVVDSDGAATILEDVALSDFAQAKLQANVDALAAEREAVADLL